MQILGLFGMYLDAAVVFVTNSSLLVHTVAVYKILSNSSKNGKKND